jgi:hypothetical protein
VTPTSAVLFKFTSGTTNVYVFVPFITASSSPISAYEIDLSSNLVPSNTLKDFNGNSALSAFNFLDLTTYNQWYSAFVGSDTVLVSTFVYKINS